MKCYMYYNVSLAHSSTLTVCDNVNEVLHKL